MTLVSTYFVPANFRTKLENSYRENPSIFLFETQLAFVDATVGTCLPIFMIVKSRNELIDEFPHFHHS